MKVYVVTSGCYSDYHIEAVFTDKKTAYAFANIHTDREVEEYDADSVKIATAPMKAKILYDPEANEIASICTDDYVQERLWPKPDQLEYGHFVAYRELSDRALKDIQKNGKKSSLLLKAMQDAWSEYKYEHEYELNDDEEEKLIQVSPSEGAKMFKVLANAYNIMFASTSSKTGDDMDEQDKL